MPKRNTDKLPLKSDVAVRICRREAASHVRLAGKPHLPPGAAGSSPKPCPPALAVRPPRVRSATSSNCKTARPLRRPVECCRGPGRRSSPAGGRVRRRGARDGVVLRWNPAIPPAASAFAASLLTRVHRARAAPVPLPRLRALEQNLLVDSDPRKMALDKHIAFGNTYEYRAQRVARVTVDGQYARTRRRLSAPHPRRRDGRVSARRAPALPPWPPQPTGDRHRPRST